MKSVAILDAIRLVEQSLAAPGLRLSIHGQLS